MIRDNNRVRDIFNFIVEYLEKHGYAPTRREIGAGVGISSTGVVNYYIDWLVENGYLERKFNAPRAIVPKGAEFTFLGDRP